MKTKKNIVKIILVSIILMLILCHYNVFAAASVNASVYNNSLNVGETTSLSITASGCAGVFSVTSSNNEVVSVSSSSTFVEGTVMETAITLTAKGEGTATITISASDVTEAELDADGNPVDFKGSTSIKITVTDPNANNQEPETPSEPEIPTTPEQPETPTTPEEPQTPVVTEPTFTNANKTMYATRDCNLRASWSTASAATSIEEGTELNVTGTSTEKIDGYVWYRVSYNGQTKYIANYLLTSTKPEEEEKSDNAYLKSLTVEGQELLPAFNKETTTYTMQVTDDVTELNIKAEAEDEKATVEIQGNKDLKEGENTVTITVNAEDNTIKIYEITVTKSEKIALGLKLLIIKGTDIQKEFKTNVYNYEIDIEDVTELDIEAVANDEKATVEILGNEDLQDGENVITIIVSSEDEEEKVTYQIKANKGVVQTAEVTESKQQPKGQISSKIYFYIALGAVLLIALIIVIVHVIEHRNQEFEYDYSDNYDEFPEELTEELPEEFPGELPDRIQKERQVFIEEVEQEFNEKVNEEINFEKTQPIDTINNNYQEEYQDEYQEEYKEEPFVQESIDEDIEKEERRAKIDYFLDSQDEDEKRRNRRGKHF